MKSEPGQIRRRAIALALFWALGAAAPGQAERMTALARALPGPVVTELRGSAEAGLSLELHLSQPVPWRVVSYADPWRLVLEFSAVDWAGFDPQPLTDGGLVRRVLPLGIEAGWSRLVLELAQPMRVVTAVMDTAGGAAPARLALELHPVSGAEARAVAEAGPGPQPQAAPGIAGPVAAAPERLRVALDPGHGGRDPGAGTEDAPEAALVLTFALELEEVLIRAGFDVRLTRREDVFVPLEERVSLARADRADVFLSLHADAVQSGHAEGITIYTYSDETPDAASQRLVERHSGDDLVQGLDLTGQGDALARVVMDLARVETAPRSDRLAEALVEGLRQTVGGLYQRPHQSADFAVLRAPDIPSVLIELGFLSAPRDLARLQSPDWRARAQEGIAAALAAWALEDAASRQLMRR